LVSQGRNISYNTKITINLREKTPQRYGETQSYTKNSVFLRASPYLCVNFLAHFKFHFGIKVAFWFRKIINLAKQDEAELKTF
jgi:hypothetical protein